MAEEGTERTTLEQLNEKLEQILEYVKAIEKNRKFQVVLEYRLFLFSFLIGVMGSLLTFCFTQFLIGEGSQRIFWLFPLAIGSIMIIMAIVPDYLRLKKPSEILKMRNVETS